MMKKLLNRLALTVAFVGVLSAPLMPVAVHAQTVQDVCEGVALTGGSCDAPAGSPTVDSVVQTVVNVLSMIVGAVSVIMIIIGGFKYITSNGDANNVTSAKNTILYAIVGLVIVLLAQVIVRFVIDTTT